MDVIQNIQKNCVYCGALSPSGAEYCCDACQILDQGLAKLESWSSPSQMALKKYVHFDFPQIKEKYILNKDRHQFQFFVDGLQCSSCVHLIEKIPEYYPECKLSRINFGTGLLTIELSENGQLAQVMVLLEELGYKPTLIEKTDNVHEKYIQSHRDDLKRIAVAGAMTAQMMGFAFGIYTGVDGTLLTLFKWANFIMFLPIVFYCALPFYKGAYNAIKYKVVHIDLPIVVALWSGFILSTYNLINGRDEFYFDSTASFIFLILVARYFVKRIQQNYLSPMNLKSLIKDEVFKNAVTEEPVLAEHIKLDDEITIQPGQILPVDGTLLNAMALIDLSMFNGESVPRTFAQGMSLKAGYKIQDHEIKIKADSYFYNSEIHHFYTQTLDQVLQKNIYLNKADRWSKHLILTVFGVSFVAFVVLYMLFGFQESFNRVLALLVIACPCALAFGSPLTLSLSYREAQKKGIAIKDANVFEKLKDIKTIFFDKTGTLTVGQLELDEMKPQVISDELKWIILSLEKSSHHPVAFAFRNAWGKKTTYTPGAYVKFEKYQENPGVGVSGWLNETCYSLLSSEESDTYGRITVNFFKEVRNHRELVAQFFFKDHLRQESANLVSDLRKRGYQVGILTGDKKTIAENIGLSCGIDKSLIHSEMSPDKKAEVIVKTENSLMIGDGINDSLALSKSKVGIALQGSQIFSVQASDVQFLKSGLSSLQDLFLIQHKALKTLDRNLWIAVVYNVVSGVFALLGLINPFVAAILMPVSTFVILLSTVYGVRLDKNESLPLRENV